MTHVGPSCLFERPFWVEWLIGLGLFDLNRDWGGERGAQGQLQDLFEADGEGQETLQGCRWWWRWQAHQERFVDLDFAPFRNFRTRLWYQSNRLEYADFLHPEDSPAMRDVVIQVGCRQRMRSWSLISWAMSHLVNQRKPWRIWTKMATELSTWMVRSVKQCNSCIFKGF